MPKIFPLWLILDLDSFCAGRLPLLNLSPKAPTPTGSEALNPYSLEAL